MSELDEIPTVDGDYSDSEGDENYREHGAKQSSVEHETNVSSTTGVTPLAVPEAAAPAETSPAQLAYKPTPVPEASEHSPDTSKAQSTSTSSGGVPKTTPQARRRTRGLSFLPVRQSTLTPTLPIGQRNVFSTNSPKSPSDSHVIESPSPTPTLHYTSMPKLSPHTPTSISTANGALQSSQAGSCSVSSTKSSANGAASSTSPSNVNAAASGYSRNESAAVTLSECMSELARKESHVGELKMKLGNLRKELVEAESDLEKYKNNMKVFAEQVYADAQTTGRPRQMGEHSDMFGISKKMVDGIGSQIWSFLGDVRSATMGISDFELEDQPRMPERGRASQHSPPRSPQRTQSNEPLPRRLSPKRSIQNLISRSPSPISSARRQALRQEQAEQHASQRIRETQRLSRKLSHLDMRSPSPVRN